MNPSTVIHPVELRHHERRRQLTGDQLLKEILELPRNDRHSERRQGVISSTWDAKKHPLYRIKPWVAVVAMMLASAILVGLLAMAWMSINDSVSSDDYAHYQWDGFHRVATPHRSILLPMKGGF